MPTRFYLSSTAVPDITPGAGTGWTVTTSFDSRKATIVKDGSAMTSKTSGAAGGVAPRSILNRQYISDPLAAQTILSGTTVNTQVRSNVNVVTSTTANMQLRIFLYSAGVFTLINGVNPGTNLTATLTNRQVADAISSNVTVLDGDRLIMEIGWFYTAGTNTTRTVINSFGSNSATDLPINNTTTTADNPWVEFSQTLLFSSTTTTKRLSLLGVG